MNRRLLGLVAGLALVAGCGGDDGPTAGELTLELTTPNPDDGAVQFTVLAPEGVVINGASAACESCRIFASEVSERELRGVVTGSIDGGPLVRLDVSDRTAEGYSITVAAVSSRDYRLRSPAAYRLRVAR